MSRSNEKVVYNKITVDSHYHFFTKENKPAFERLVSPEGLENPEFKQFLATPFIFII